jgi:hypothetical protein
MAIYPTIPLTVPTVGGSSGAWASTLNSALLALDGHQHLGVGSGGAQIVSAAININADLTFASYSATNLRSATFAAGQAVSGVRKLYVGANSELYWNNSAAGAAIQLTSGTSLNVSAFVGGIGGDYTSVSAALNYDNSAARYTLRAGGGTTWARVAAGEVRIHEHASTSSIYVALAAPAGIASPYTVTFSAAGVLTFENTGIEAATFSGLITASAGVTCAANQHVTISGTGEFKHGDRILTTNGLAGHGTNWFTDTDGCMSYGGAGTEYLLVPIGLHVGDRIKSVSFQFSGDSSVDLTVNVQSLSATMVETQIGTVTVSNQSSTWAVTTIDVTDTVIVANGSIFLECVTNAIGGRIGTICVTYDHP